MDSFLYPLAQNNKQGIRNFIQNIEPHNSYSTPLQIFAKGIQKCLQNIEQKIDNGLQQLQQTFQTHNSTAQILQTKFSNKINDGFQNLLQGLQKVTLTRRQIQDIQPLSWKEQMYHKNKQTSQKLTKQLNIISEKQEIIQVKVNKSLQNCQEISINKDLINQSKLQQKLLDQQICIDQVQQKQVNAENIQANQIGIQQKQFGRSLDIPFTDKPVHKRQKSQYHNTKEKSASQIINKKKSQKKMSNIYRINKSSSRKHSLIRQKQAQLQLKANIQFLQNIKGKTNISSTDQLKTQWVQESPNRNKKTLVDFIKDEKKKKLEDLGFKKQRAVKNESIISQNSGQNWEFLPQLRKQRKKGQIFKPVAFSIYTVSQKGSQTFQNPQSMN